MREDASSAQVKAMVDAAASGEPVELCYWDRGGPPGPGYESNHLTLRDEGKGLYAVYLKVRFDHANPPYRTDKYVAQTAERLHGVEALLRTLAGPAFAEEADPRIGDVTKVSVSVRIGDRTVERLFYQRLPDALKPLEQRALRTLALCEAEGLHTIEPRVVSS